MKTNLSCRHCQYYSPEGRRGGMCQKLMAKVESNWKACSLALPPFEKSPENEQSPVNHNSIVMWDQTIKKTLEVVLPLKPTANNINQQNNIVKVGSYGQ